MKRRLTVFFSFLAGVFVLLFAAILFTSSFFLSYLKKVSPSIAVSSPVSQAKKLPIYSVETSKKVVSITFDSAWGTEDLDCILKTLKSQNVKACFFATGEWITKYPDAIKKILADGHEIGSHGDAHKHMNTLSLDSCKEEIRLCHEKMQKLTGKEMTLFRPPYGEYNDTVLEAAKACGYYTIQWDVDSLDWKNYGTTNIINTVVRHKNLKNGSIILLHNGTKYTAQALPIILEQLKEKGYQMVPLSELILKSNYSIDPNGRQIPNAGN